MQIHYQLCMENLRLEDAIGKFCCLWNDNRSILYSYLLKMQGQPIPFTNPDNTG